MPGETSRRAFNLKMLTAADVSVLPTLGGWFGDFDSDEIFGTRPSTLFLAAKPVLCTNDSVI